MDATHRRRISAPSLPADVSERPASLEVLLYRRGVEVAPDAGAGGFVLAAADFPALMAIKVRMLADVVAIVGTLDIVFGEIDR